MTFNERIVLTLGPVVIIGIYLIYYAITTPGDHQYIAVVGGVLISSFTLWLVKYWNVKYPQ